MGGTYLQVRLSPNEEVTESDHLATFGATFEDLGLDPTPVEDFVFEYTPTNWQAPRFPIGSLWI